MISDHTSDFELTPGQIWLNAASEGPIPTVSAKALLGAIQWKLSPERLTISKFIEVPVLLKRVIGRLINVDPEDVILGNSATYGMHLLSHGLDLYDGDEVILMRNDFPTDILPWLHLKENGVRVIQLQTAGPILNVAEIEKAITVHTKVVCLPMVHSFSGWSLDIDAIGALCKKHDIVFVVNMSQVIGVYPVDMSVMPVDAIICAGYKWLLGPYGTGFCWIKPELRRQFKYDQSYWISLMDEQSLQSEGEISLPFKDNARKYDVFGTANFFNFVPWKVSIEYLLGLGIDVVSAHNHCLIEQFSCSLDKSSFDILSPSFKEDNSPIIVISHKDKIRNKAISDMLWENGVHTAYWKNNIRISPHIYNTQADIERLISLLDPGR